MPTVSSTFSVSNFGDGAGSTNYVIDLAAALSSYYGKLIRQGNAFRITGYGVRVFNPNTVVQDESLSASGKLVFYEPTGNRKKAWKKAFQAVQHQRKLMGITEKGYDFRVGLHSSYAQVPQQAWIRDSGEELSLGSGSTDRNGIFAVHNSGLIDDSLPEDAAMNGFGSPYDFAGLTEGDADFKDGLGDTGFYTPGTASQLAGILPFQAAAAGIYDAGVFASGGDIAPAWTNAQMDTCDVTVMCGLLGVVIDTTIVDDTTGQTQDTAIEVMLDVHSWSPLLPKRKSTRRKSRAGSKRRRKSRK